MYFAEYVDKVYSLSVCISQCVDTVDLLSACILQFVDKVDVLFVYGVSQCVDKASL